MLEGLENDFKKQISNFELKEMKQLEINRKLESDVEHAEKAFMVRYETTASAQDHDTLRVLENQISDL